MTTLCPPLPPQFPDPHFKRKHRKRRVVQPQLVAALARLVRSGGRVLLQSDVEEVRATRAGDVVRVGVLGILRGGWEGAGSWAGLWLVGVDTCSFRSALGRP